MFFIMNRGSRTLFRPSFIVPYHTPPHPTLSYRTVPYQTQPDHTIPHQTPPYRTLPNQDGRSEESNLCVFLFLPFPYLTILDPTSPDLTSPYPTPPNRTQPYPTSLVLTLNLIWYSDSWSDLLWSIFLEHQPSILSGDSDSTETSTYEQYVLLLLCI